MKAKKQATRADKQAPSAEPPPDFEFLHSLGFTFECGGMTFRNDEFAHFAMLNFPLYGTEFGDDDDSDSADDCISVTVENPAVEREHVANWPLSPPVTEWQWGLSLNCSQLAEPHVYKYFGPLYLRERWEIRALVDIARLSASRSMFYREERASKEWTLLSVREPERQLQPYVSLLLKECYPKAKQ